MRFFTVFACGLICLSAVSAAPPTDEQIKHMEEAVKKCITESGVDPTALESARKGEAADDEKLACFGACMMQDMGVMDDMGKIKKDVAIAHLPDHVPKDEAIKVIEACAEEDGGSPCATAALVFKCLKEKKAEGYFRM